MSGPTPAKISKISGFDTATFSWQSDTEFYAYKVKVVATSGAAHSTGTLIPVTAGSTNMSAAGTFLAETNIESTVNGTDLETASAGDGDKVIKIFVQDVAGNWNS